jgi:hypothetical protein
MHYTEAALIAVALLGAAGFTRVAAPPGVVNVIGWVVFGLAVLLVAIAFLRG